MDFSQYGGPSEEWLAVEKTLPALTFDIDSPLDTLKAQVNSSREDMSAKVMAELASQVTMQDFSIPTRDGSTIPARSYQPKSLSTAKPSTAYLHFHGGGFFFGTLDSENASCARHALKGNICVINACYRHTPEHPFPTAWHDAQDAFAWLHTQTSILNIDPHRIVVGGISAGAQLTASLVLEKHLHLTPDPITQLPAPAGQILIIPALAHLDTYADGPGKLLAPGKSSYIENENAPILPKKTVRFFTDLLRTPTPPAALDDTKLNVVNASSEQVAGLPPTVFGIAGLDPLRDEGLLFAKRVAEAGVPTWCRLFRGVPHGFRRFGERLKVCARWDECVDEGVEWVVGMVGREKVGRGRLEVEVV